VVLGVLDRLVLNDIQWERIAPLIIGRPDQRGSTGRVNPSRAQKYPIDKHLYAQRHLIECCFSKLKQFRRVATRFEKTARNYLAVVTLAAIVLWLR
jgi:transposase